MQDALVEAVRAWPDDPPQDPKGWLVTVAWRRFLDATRTDTSRRDREERVEAEPAPGPADDVDDTLQLYFLCAHPSLTPASAVALTLRAVGGLTTRQIAEAYLVPEATMAQRISRAKRTVEDVRFDQPGDVATVLRVLYLVFNEGYSGDVDLAGEAIRLTRQLAAADRPRGGRRPARADAAPPRPAPGPDRPRRQARAAGRAGPQPVGHAPDRRGRRRAPARPSPATAWASSRPRPPSPRSTPTPGRPRRPTGCRSSSGTTSWCASPAARSPASTGPSRSARRTAPRAGLAALAELDPALPRYTAVAAYLHERDGDPVDRGAALRRGRPGGHQPPRARPPDPPGRAAERATASLSGRWSAEDRPAFPQSGLAPRRPALLH